MTLTFDQLQTDTNVHAQFEDWNSTCQDIQQKWFFPWPLTYFASSKVICVMYWPWSIIWIWRLHTHTIFHKLLRWNPSCTWNTCDHDLCPTYFKMNSFHVSVSSYWNKVDRQDGHNYKLGCWQINKAKWSCSWSTNPLVGFPPVVRCPLILWRHRYYLGTLNHWSNSWKCTDYTMSL